MTYLQEKPRPARAATRNPNGWIRTLRVGEPTRLTLAAVAVGLVTFFVHGYRLAVAPDVLADEGIYLGVATNFASGAGLTLNHSVFLWHPPAYMFVEAAYIKLAGLPSVDSINTLLSVRYLNIFFSAATAALLMLFGRKLHSYKAGLAAAALFLMDPYVQRINRHAMLETLAMLLVLLALYIFFTRRPHLTARQRLGAGVAFGLAMLTNEAMFLELLGLIAYVLWCRRSQLRDVAWVAGIASAIYLPYPSWVVGIGQGDKYLFLQLFGVTRVLQSLPGYPPPHVTTGPAPRPTFSLANLQSLLPQYEMSYLLLLLAAIFIIFLIFRFRHVREARFLAAWGIVSFGIGVPLGITSDQHFYYMVVPSTLVAGYVLAWAAEGVWTSPLAKTKLRLPDRPRSFVRRWLLVFAAFAVLVSYNTYVWVSRYAVGSDDAYIGAIRYAEAHVPKGATVVSSNTVPVYFLSRTHNVRLDRHPGEVVARCERYFIMSSKDAWGRYYLTTRRFYDWVVQRSQPLYVRRGHSFWKVGVYARRAAATRNGRCNSGPDPRARAKTRGAANRGAARARLKGAS